MDKKTIGIIGGMGPMATVDLFSKIVSNTDAKCDSQHAHVIIDNVPTIPNRVHAIMGTGPSPLEPILRSATRLKQAGADFFIMPCNTAHYWFREIREGSGLEGVSIIQETVRFLKAQGVGKVGLLATDGTLRANVYNEEFSVSGIEQVTPSEAGQKEIMRLVFECVKAGKEPGDLALFREELAQMRKRGAEMIVAGCTELPILFSQFLPDVPVVDATDILARAAVHYAGYPLKDRR